ncbi:MAG: hypothetical protein Q9228_004865 [Teloschistes exilis]
MLFTTLFQLTALAALLDPILAQNWTISAYNDGKCEPSEFIFEDNENSTGPEGFGCHTFFNSDLANSVQWNGGGFWCVSLYDNDECSGQPTKELGSGASGCQDGTTGGFTLRIPSHGFPCS